MAHYESLNAYDDEHFPSDWDDDDLAFLAEFVSMQFGARLQQVVDESRDYDYELYRRVDD